MNEAASRTTPSPGDAVARARLALHRYAMPGLGAFLIGLFAFSASQGFPDRVEAAGAPIVAVLALAAGVRARRTGVPSERLERLVLFAAILVLVAAAFEVVFTGRFEVGYPYVLGYGPLAYAASFLFLGTRAGSRLAVLTYVGLAAATVAGVATGQIPAVRAMPLVGAHPLLIGLLAAVAWTMSAVAREHRRAEIAAATDPLTGALNRRSGEALLADAEGWIRLVMVDLDGFKSVNDRRGHAFGDDVLRRVTGALREAVRSGDAVIRWGGDEFLVVARTDGDASADAGTGDHDPTDALQARVRDGVNAVAKDLGLDFGASIGVATRRPGESWTEAFVRADADMYADKAARGADRAAAPGA